MHTDLARSFARTTTIAVLGLACAASAGLADPAPDRPAFRIEALAEGVHLFRPAAPGPGRANSLVVERADGLLVVDAQPTPDSARELLAEIARRFASPVRYLVLSHPHAEAAGGATAFPQSALLIASAGCAAALADPDYDFGAEERVTSLGEWQAPARATPTLAIRATADLADPQRPVTLRVHARAHSGGDLTVYLPHADLLYTGGLVVVDRNPYGGDADVKRWLGMLSSMIVEPVRTIVGVQGPAADVRAVIRQRDAFAWLRGQVEEGFVDRLGEHEIVARVLASGDLGRWFDTARLPQFIAQLTEQVVAEAVTQRRKRGVPVNPEAEAGAADGRPAPGSS